MQPMKIANQHLRTITPDPGHQTVEIIDQTQLPHAFSTRKLSTLADAATAIRDMHVRGAPLIGATAAYGVALALATDSSDNALQQAIKTLAATRPTAVNLHWALQRMAACLTPLAPVNRLQSAWAEAQKIADEDALQCKHIGDYGLSLLQPLMPRDRPLNVMTHCNAGWLATVDYGTAIAPVYAAFDAGVPIHVFVSETRPRNQGLLTAWELNNHGVPHTLIADNAAGLLLSQGEVDAVIVGADRVAANGDVANKVGTYLKALAAHAANVPFYVAVPTTTIDRTCASGKEIPIEERDGDELRCITGLTENGRIATIRQLAASTSVSNPAFDVTPAALVTALITERGIVPATPEGIASLFTD